MNSIAKKLKILPIAISTSFLVCSTTFAQGNTGSDTYLTKQQRTVIIDSILSGDLARIRNLARRQPAIAAAAASLHAKHSGARGRAAGAIAASIVTAIDGNVDEATDVAAGVCKSTTASLEEVAEISDEVTNALGLNNNPESYAEFIGKLTAKLGLRGEQAGDFVSIICGQGGSERRGYDCGKIAGTVALIGDFSAEETEQMLASILNTLNPDPEEAEQLASAIELETGKELIVQIDDSGGPSPVKGGLQRQPELENPADEIAKAGLQQNKAQDVVSSFAPDPSTQSRTNNGNNENPTISSQGTTTTGSRLIVSDIQ